MNKYHVEIPNAIHKCTDSGLNKWEEVTQFIDLFNIESFVVKIGVRIKYFTGYTATCLQEKVHFIKLPMFLLYFVIVKKALSKMLAFC